MRIARVHKENVFAIGTFFRPLTKDAIACILQPLEITFHVFGSESKVVQAWAAFFQKTGDGGVLTERLQQFDFRPTSIEEIGSHPFGSHFFGFIRRSPEQGLEMGKTGFNIADGNADVFKYHG